MSSLLHTWKKIWAIWLFVEETPAI